MKTAEEQTGEHTAARPLVVPVIPGREGPRRGGVPDPAEVGAAAPEAVPAAPPRAGFVQQMRGHLDLFTNAGSLILTSGITSLLGFVYWWLAARTASTEAVGQTSAAVSAMTLIGTIGMFGMGTMLIAELPRMAGRRWSLINTCLLVSGTVATVGGLVYVALAHVAIPGLRDALGDTFATVLLVIGIALTAITLVLDEALVGLLAGPLQLTRNTWFAAGKLALLAALAVLPMTVTGGELLLTWLAGAVLSLAALRRVLKRRGMIDSARPRLSLLRGMGRATFDNNLLNLATFLPRAAMPLVVTAVLSTRANAAFYTAWMVVAVLAMVPGNVALTLYAVASGDRGALRAKVRLGLLICFGGGVPVSIVMIVAANPIMSIFGEEYAATASGALAILSLTYVPFIFHHFFLAISRVKNRVRGAGIFSIFAGLTELAAAWWGGRHGDLSTLTWWVTGVMALEALLVAPVVLRVVLPDRHRPDRLPAVVSTRRMTLRERVWLPLEYIRTVGPLTGVDADRLRAALVGLHGQDATNHAVTRIDRDAARWLHLDPAAFAAYVAEAVTEVSGAAADPDAMSRALQAEPRGHHPVRILVGGGFVAVKIAHVYGDAGTVNTLVRELIRAAAEGRPARLTDSGGPKRPLRRGLWDVFGGHPGRLRAALRLERPPWHDATEGRPWRADLTVRTARSATVLDRMRTWRDEHAAGTTTSAITFAAFAAALTEVGLNPDLDGAMFLFDARRYVPDGAAVGGNFCWGQYLAPVSLTDPKAIHRALKAELATGRILAVMGLREARVAVRGTSGWPAAYPGFLADHPRPRLTFSNQGRHDVLADLPWADGPSGRVNHSVPTLSGPEGITLTTSEMAGALHLEATFHASTFDPALVERALRLVCEDPAALIAAHRATA